MTSHASGNTIPSACVFKARSFLFTLNEVDKYESLKTLLTSLKSMDYFLSAEEIAPTTGHKHMHIYVHFNNTYRLNQKIIKIGAHIDICKGSPQQNINYVKKDGKVIDEIGEPPQQGGLRVKDLKELDNPDELDWKVYHTWKKINEEKVNDIDIDEWKKDIEVYWIMGPSGIGKTERAKQIVRDNAEKYGTKVNIVKYTNTFWQGVGNAKIAIYDDFRDSHMHPSEFINFIDYNIHTINIKGGEKRNEYNLIIITSVQDPHFIYPGMKDNEPRYQWLRRMTIVDLTPPPTDKDQASIDEVDIDIDALG